MVKTYQLGMNEEEQEKSLMDRNEEDVDLYIEKSDYEDMIKNRCFLCGLKFENSWHYYITYGNICRSCSGRVAKYMSPKFRDRKDESLDLLRLRRQAVKNGDITKNI